MQRVDFFRLERPIQERFISSARGNAPPLPLAVRREGLRPAAIGWGVGALLGIVVLVLLWRWGFGRLTSDVAIQPLRFLFVDAALGAAIAASAVAAVRAQRARHALPFEPAVYLFPSGVIDTRNPQFVVRPLSELLETRANGRSVNLKFQDGAAFDFPTPSAEHAAEVLRSVEGLRQRPSGEIAPTSSRELAVYDPLCDNGFRNPFSPRESMLPPRSRWMFTSIAGALALGALTGSLAWKIRNSLAQRALYSAALKANTREGYEAYVAHGGDNANVRDILLPRAELAEVVARHSIAELERFADAHRGSRVDPEVQSALRQALLGALGEARSQGTLKALKEFRARFERHAFLADDIQRAIDERLAIGLREFQRRAQPRPEVLEVFRHLFAYGAAHDGRVELRFRRRMPDSIAHAQMLIEKSLWYGGPQSLPAQYFDDAHASERERPMAATFLAALAQAVPEDYLKFETAPPLEDKGEDDPEVSVPTLLVTHRTEMSGAYLMRSPRAALTGVGVLFRVSILIPHDPTSYTYKYSSWNAPDFKSTMEGASFEKIYTDMAHRAFVKLEKRYLADLLPGISVNVQD
jgi:hypothetical protein